MKELKDRIVAGERAAIAKAITLVESSREEDIQQSHELISQLIKSPGHPELHTSIFDSFSLLVCCS